MAVRPRNILASRSKAVGFRELQQKFRDLMTSLGQEDKQRRNLLSREQHRILREGAEEIAVEARRRAVGRVPKRVVASIFTFANPATDKPKRTAALVGVNKRRTMVEWFARGASTRSPWVVDYRKGVKRKAASGKRIAMSLATMFERGTSRMAALPYFAPAVRAVRARVVATTVAKLKDLIEKFS